LRVKQNTAWLERMLDPDTLTDLRIELRALRSVREADWAHALDSLSNEAQAARHEVERHQQAEQDFDLALQRERTEIERLREVERTLGLVYAGGWWRLRGRLLATLPFIAPLNRLIRDLRLHLSRAG
jgi:hypothetical protein